MDSNDSSRRQRQAGLARGRQIRGRSRLDPSRSSRSRGSRRPRRTATGTATRRKLGCRFPRQPLPV